MTARDTTKTGANSPTTAYALGLPANVPKAPPPNKESCAYCGCAVHQAGSAAVLANPYCQRTRDHIVPAMMGTAYLSSDNVVVCCRACNDIKANYPYEVFAYFMRHTKSQPLGQRRLAINQFVYSLARVGLIACLLECSAQTGKPAVEMHKPRGRYTAKDLRKAKSEGRA